MTVTGKEKRMDYRPKYHMTAKEGWINDPCGIYRDERKVWHLFYQFHPGTEPDGTGTWGHQISRDLLCWEERQPVLQPEFDYEKDGCWTGTALRFHGKILLYYSGNAEGRIPQQAVCLAESRDGIRFEKFGKNPLIAEITPEGHTEMRDPKVFLRNGKCYIVQGACRNGRAEVLLYESEDGYHWNYRGIFWTGNSFCGNMAECPGFFTLDETDYLILSCVGSGEHKNIAVSGRADWEKGTFVQKSLQELDLGSSFYAAQAAEIAPNEVFLIAWMSAWGKNHPEGEEGWAGMMTLPRQLYHKSGGRLCQKPVQADGRFWERTKEWKGPSGEKTGPLIRWKGSCGRFCLAAEAETGIRLEAVLFADSPGEKRFCFAKTEGVLRLEIYLDHCAVEIFADDGETVITEQIYGDSRACHVIDAKKALGSWQAHWDICRMPDGKGP